MIDIINAKLGVIKSLAPVLILVGIVTVAIVERVKAEWKPEKNFWYTVISLCVGAVLFALFVYTSPIVIAFFFAGLLESLKYFLLLT